MLCMDRFIISLFTVTMTILIKAYYVPRHMPDTRHTYVRPRTLCVKDNDITGKTCTWIEEKDVLTKLVRLNKANQASRDKTPLITQWNSLLHEQTFPSCVNSINLCP